MWQDNQNNRYLVQVCFSFNDPATRKREISSITRAMKELNLQESKIVTLDEEDLLKEGDKRIKIIPAWKYLLDKG